MNELLKQDKIRTKKLPLFQILLRKSQRGGYYLSFIDYCINCPQQSPMWKFQQNVKLVEAYI